MIKPLLTNKKYWPALIIVAAVLISVLMFKTRPELTAQPVKINLPTVSVMSVMSQSRTLTVSAQGSVVPRTESNIIPEVNGRVVWMSPSLVTGGYIEQGQELLKIDQADYRDASALAQATLVKAQVEAELASAELKRLKKLQAKNLASQSQLDQAHRTSRVADANQLDASIKLKQAQRDLKRTTLTAPYTGRIRSKQVDVGQFVSRGETIASTYATDTVEIRLPIVDRKLAFLNLPMTSAGNLDDKQQAEVVVTGEYAGQKHQWQGKLVRTEAELDANSRMVYGVVRVANDSDNSSPLLVGMFVNATILGRTVDNIFEVPRIAVRDSNQVLVLDSDNRLHFREIKVLRIERDKVLISHGLSDGEKISTSPMAFMVNGIEVNAVDASDNTADGANQRQTADSAAEKLSSTVKEGS